MSFARLGRTIRAEFHDISPPFSNFQFVDSQFPGDDYSAVRRLFSLARKDDLGKSVVIEDIEPFGAVADEIDELAAYYPSYRCDGLKRLTFWGMPCASEASIRELADDDLLGYAILKQDTIPDLCSRWHIFESVFRKYGHHHNCVPGEGRFRVACGQRTFEVPGVMYCQQNSLNKACAQVALRSLLSRIVPTQDILYRDMNAIAREIDQDFKIGQGLDSTKIRAILDYYSVLYDDLDYTAPGVSTDFPYSRLLYSGIENGMGGLLGFELAGAGAQGERHIIPFYGHTFNQDSWVPRASLAYFHVGDNTRYISSEEWMGSFIGHDDNFGGNYCVPRKFLETHQVKYVVALRPPDTAYGAIYAEAIGVDFLYSMEDELRASNNYWVQKLVHHIYEQDVVLRTLYMSRGDYVAHLLYCRDWQGSAEEKAIPLAFQTRLPEHLWIVEVSIPELFPANYRKLGELILDARVPTSDYQSGVRVELLARLPGAYYINLNPAGVLADFKTIPSTLRSHVAVHRGRPMQTKL